ncbi:MAG TPA: hypothetical protein VD860_03460, partial [Azospirillum sp.]|nr:hypothetical protein [Azospirillum sp.]
MLDHADDTPRSSSARRLLPLAVLAAGFAAFFALGLHRTLTLEGLAAQRAGLTAFVEAQGALAVLAYVGV